MFTINDDSSIYLTRGDIAIIEVSANTVDDEEYKFMPGDVLRINVVEKKKCNSVVLSKDVIVNSETPTVDIHLERKDTRIGDTIHKPRDYWYEIVLNPDTAAQTLVGYDSDGPKVFRLYPEGVHDAHTS